MFDEAINEYENAEFKIKAIPYDVKPMLDLLSRSDQEPEDPGGTPLTFVPLCLPTLWSRAHEKKSDCVRRT